MHRLEAALDRACPQRCESSHRPGITMICSGTQGPEDVAKCLLAYTALIAATTPELSEDARGKVLSTLTSGLEVGNEISLAIEERKYVLQKSLGLWFHVMAADGED